MIKNIENYFSECGYAEDFEAVVSLCDVLEGFNEAGYSLWLKAYDTSCCENEKEKRLFDSGYKFDCYAWVTDETGRVFNCELNAYAKTKDDAVEWFGNAISDKRNLDKFVRGCIAMG